MIREGPADMESLHIHEGHRNVSERKFAGRSIPVAAKSPRGVTYCRAVSPDTNGSSARSGFPTSCSSGRKQALVEGPVFFGKGATSSRVLASTAIFTAEGLLLGTFSGAGGDIPELGGRMVPEGEDAPVD